ncbi:MAG: calcium/sodium antiporter [Anaerovoracaceae bacterium]|nr:calcium/sodium antiporter [Bacillota bacterium]MDY5770824.1 calcium/sodium antiporter [Anaerovoracaceae bacterium]
MELAVTIFLFIVGLALIIKGGDVFVDAATWAADISGIPKFIIGATVVSLATTLPELLVSLFASLEGKVDIAIGNAVGSVTANTGLIMAISMICLPSIAKRKSIGWKSVFLILSTGLLLLFSQDGRLGTVESIVLLVIFAVSIWDSISKGKKATELKNASEGVTVKRKEILTNSMKFVLGAAAIVIGADMLVDYGSSLARFFGISEAIIGATLIAVGTSIPELVTTITAIAKREASLSVGNIIGANVIDITLIMPLCTLLSGKDLPVSGQNLVLDIPACFAIIVMALVPMLLREKYTRIHGFIIMAAYIVYLYLVLTGAYASF